MSNKAWYYAEVPGTRVGRMICTACNKPIESGQFRYHTTKEAHLPQHRACSENDPKWKSLDDEKLVRISAARATLDDLKRIQQRGFWDVSEDIEEIESILGDVEEDVVTSLNWNPVVGSLLKTLQDHNFTLVSVDNGDGKEALTGTERQRRQQAKKLICAVDVAELFITHPSSPSRSLWVYIVLGNEPEETVCDHTHFDVLNLAVEQFSRKWEGKPTPTK